MLMAVFDGLKNRAAEMSVCWDDYAQFSHC